MMDLLGQRESGACAEHSKSGCGGAFLFGEDFEPSNYHNEHSMVTA